MGSKPQSEYTRCIQLLLGSSGLSCSILLYHEDTEGTLCSLRNIASPVATVWILLNTHSLQTSRCSARNIIFCVWGMNSFLPYLISMCHTQLWDFLLVTWSSTWMSTLRKSWCLRQLSSPMLRWRGTHRPLNFIPAFQTGVHCTLQMKTFCVRKGEDVNWGPTSCSHTLQPGSS